MKRKNTKPSKAMKIKCAVACRNSVGEPELFPCVVECTKDEYDNGKHYDEAKSKAEDEGYEVKSDAIVFDQNDGPKFLFDNLSTSGLSAW